MGLSARQRLNIVISVVLLAMFLFANVYTVRKMMQYGLKLYFFDKLNVAYQTGGRSGLEKELNSMVLKDKMPREATLAQEFREDIKYIKDPGTYLTGMVEDSKTKAVLFRSMRIIAFGLIAIIVFFRFIFNFTSKPGARQEN